MALAISLGARGLGQVWPNPAVGCVLVQNGIIVGRGWTQPGGRPHAEVVALAQAGARARGAVAYVSLEPCAHVGKTGPCCDALIAAGVVRVVSALTDPDARVSGQGHARLRSAGIEVVEGVLGDQARAVQAGFLTRVMQGRPMVTLKLALSVDGRIATAAGESRWITGPEARRRVHAERARHDAVLVGAGTARADDPDLSVRDLGPVAQPVRIVADARLDLPIESRLGRSIDRAPVWLVHGPDAPAQARAAWQQSGARLFEVAVTAQGWLEPAAVMAALGGAGLTRVLCEGGGQWAASLLTAELVDRLMVFSAGHVFGERGRAGVGAIVPVTLGDPAWRLCKAEVVGRDFFNLWQRVV